MCPLDAQAAFDRCLFRVRHFGRVFISPYKCCAHVARSVDCTLATWSHVSTLQQVACVVYDSVIGNSRLGIGMRCDLP